MWEFLFDMTCPQAKPIYLEKTESPIFSHGKKLKQAYTYLQV